MLQKQTHAFRHAADNDKIATGQGLPRRFAICQKFVCIEISVALQLAVIDLVSLHVLRLSVSTGSVRRFIIQ